MKKKSKNDEAPRRQGTKDELQTVNPEYINHLKDIACWKFTSRGAALFRNLFKRWQEHDKKNNSEVKFATEIMGFEPGVNPGGASANMKKVVAGNKCCNGWALYRLTCEINNALKENFSPTDFAKAIKTGRVSHFNVKKSRQYMDEVWNLYDARIEFEPDARSLAKKYRRRGTPKSVREILDMLLRDFREAIANQYSAILPVLYWFRSKMGITVITLAALVIAGLYFVFLTPDIGRVANDTVESSRLEASTLRDADTMPVHTSEKRLPEGLSSTKGQNANSHDETENLNYSERSSELAVDSELNENADPNNATQWDTSQIGDSDDSENTADLFIETNLGNVYLLVGPHSLAVKLGNSYDLKMKILKPRSDPECSFNGKTYLCRLTDRRLGKYSVRFGSALGYITPETVTVELKKPSTYIKRFYQRQK